MGHKTGGATIISIVKSILQLQAGLIQQGSCQSLISFAFSLFLAPAMEVEG
jgi:hypothetical protein